MASGDTRTSLDSIGRFFDVPERPGRLEFHDALAHTELTLFGRAPRPPTLGRYVVLSEVGRGAQGMVLAAYDPMLDRKVAIKLIRAGGATTDDTLVSEARAASRISHPNVVAVYDAGRYDAPDPGTEDSPEPQTPGGGVYMVMELVEEIDLGLWRRREPRTWSEIVQIYLRAALGLIAAHEHDVVHLDFKPHNVLVTDAGVPKVADFGLASRPNSEASPLVGGTPLYMPPEQYKQVEGTPDARADQYAFCVALYEALYGLSPFVASHPRQTLERKLSGAPAAPIAKARVPPRVFRVLQRGLEPKPSDRFPSMAALVRELQRASHGNRVRFAIAGLVAVTLGVVWAARSLTPQDHCQSARDELAGVWDEATAQRVRRELAASDAPYAQHVAATLTQELDEYAASWLSVRERQCHAHYAGTSRDSEESPNLCLAHSRARLAGVVNGMRSDPANGLLSGARMIDGLPLVSECEQTDGDEFFSTNAWSDVMQFETMLGAAVALPEERESIAMLKAVVQRADEIDEPWLRARARLELGIHLADTNPAEATETLLDALTQAERAGDERAVVNVLIELGRVSSNQQHAFEQARRYLDVAQAKIERHELGWWPRSRYRLTRGTALSMERKYQEALVELEAARKIRVEHLGADHPFVAAIDGRIAQAWFFLGDAVRAAEYNQRKLDVIQARLGADHPDVLRARSNNAVLAKGAGRYGEALAILSETVPKLVALLGDDGRTASTVKYQLAPLLAIHGRTDEALQLFGEILDQRIDTLGPEDRDVVHIRTTLASALILAGRVDDGATQVAQARRVFDEIDTGDDARLAFRIALQEVRVVRARGDLVLSAARAEAMRADLELDDYDSAVLSLEEAVIDCERHGADNLGGLESTLRAAEAAALEPFNLEIPRHALARCMARLDPPRARKLAETALANLERSGLTGAYVDRIRSDLAGGLFRSPSAREP